MGFLSHRMKDVCVTIKPGRQISIRHAKQTHLLGPSFAIFVATAKCVHVISVFLRHDLVFVSDHSIMTDRHSPHFAFVSELVDPYQMPPLKAPLPQRLNIHIFAECNIILNITTISFCSCSVCFFLLWHRSVRPAVRHDSSPWLNPDKT